MELNYIIIQAGGKGTRLGHLTRNRPKAIVPVNNRPLIFHLFEKYPKANFVIIGDYKFDVLEAYLENFATVSFLLVQAEGEGNACGIREALRYIPEKMPFMLIWSDLLLDDGFDIGKSPEGCYIGVTDKFPCSWRYLGNSLEKVPCENDGVAGMFIFDRKERLEDIPESGSFTRWLQGQNIVMQPISLQDSMEAGTLEAVGKIDHSNENRCRPYNKIMFLEDKVVKEGITPEGKELIKKEVHWYEAVSKHGYSGIPKIYGTLPLTMQKIDGENIFRADLSEQQKKRVVEQLIDKLNELHCLEKADVNMFDMQEDYYDKTLKRLYSIRNVIPFSNCKTIVINGKECFNPIVCKDKFQDMVRSILDTQTAFGIIHGDGTLTNTMIDKDGEIYFIDARGYFGRTLLYGDVYYDWAKLYYSLEGAFDQFNIKNFTLEITREKVEYSIHPSGWEQYTEYFMKQIPGCDIYRVRLIHAVIWLSLASHCWEDYDSMCLAFYQGVYLLNELDGFREARFA